MNTRYITFVVLAALGCKSEPGIKKNEAQLQLERLGKLLATKFAELGRFPVGKAGPTPALDSCQTRPRERPWDDDATWREIGFSIETPVRYTYAYEGTPTGFTATAMADLDCDLAGSTVFTLTGTVKDAAPVIGKVERQPGED